MTKDRVLIVEDDALIAWTIAECLGEDGYEVCGTAVSYAEAISLADRHRPRLAVIDVRLAGNGNGFDAAEYMARHHGTAVLYATANYELVKQRATVGIGCLRKPYRPAILVRALAIVQQLARQQPFEGPVPAELILLDPVHPASSTRVPS